MMKGPRQHAQRGRAPLAPARAMVMAGALLSAPFAIQAGPTGGDVVAGSGTIQRPDANTTLIQQQSHSLALDWSGFDVAGHELVQFQQPSSSATVLNRVFNELPSQIHGSIQANGHVFIINPNGVVFGPGARIEVGALMASSLDIKVDDFMNGLDHFSAPDGRTPGAIVNRGLIKAATGGGVTLLGGAVRNDGVIIADLGHVLLGAGRQALVDFDGDGLIRFHVDEAVLEDVSDDASAVHNSGEILADGGQVLLSAAVARGIVDNAVNNSGIIRAAGIDRSTGVVRLSAAGGGVANSGVIDVSASPSGGAGVDGGKAVLESDGTTLLDTGSEISARASVGRGGEVHVLGDSVAIMDAATIDASGGLGGGTVLVGGDYQGANPEFANARVTGIAAGARILADATGSGDGGRVIVWSDETTRFYGRISARGGPSGGDGGFAEVSGKQHLAFRGSADLGAARGSRGTLLLDPALVVIHGGSPDSNATRVGMTAGQILFADDGPSVVYQSEIETQSVLSDITLQATQSVSTEGRFDDATLALAADSSLLIETRNHGVDELGIINLIASEHGTSLNIETSGSGTITVRSGSGGDRSTPILLPNLISASDIVVSTGGAPSSPVLVFGTLSGANVDIDASGLFTVLGGSRVVAGGDGTSLSVDARGITLLGGEPGAATLTNSGTGTVSLVSTGAANIVLGENAIANGVGLVSLASGRSIVAINLTDIGDALTEITSAGAGDVTLDSGDGIDEAKLDDGLQVAAEITSDGRVTLVAKSHIGEAGLLDLASASTGVSALQATSQSGAVRVRARDTLRVEGSGIRAAGGGSLAAGRALTIAANVESGAGMTFTTGVDATRAGDDLNITGGAVVALDSASPATLRFEAGDHIVFDGGSVQTAGTSGHHVELHADAENGGSDGVTGGISQTGVETSVSTGHLIASSGGGIGSIGALQTAVMKLSVDNTTSGNVQLFNRGDVETIDDFHNQALGAALTLTTDDGGIDTGNAHVSSNAGPATLDAAHGIRLGGPVDTGTGELRLRAGAAIEQLAGRIASASVRSHSGDETVLAGSDNAIERISAFAGGDVALSNGVVLTLGATDVGGSLDVDNAQSIAVAERIHVAEKATLTTSAEGIEGAGGRIEAAELALDSAAGIGAGTALETDISGEVLVRSRGSGNDGDIRIVEHGNFATSQLQLLATDTSSAQSVSITAGDVLSVDKDPVDTPELVSGDRLELDATRIDLAEKISGVDVDVRFKAPVHVTESAFITLKKGLLTFDENVTPGSNTTLTLRSEVVFASGQVTGQPDSSLVITGALNLVTDTTIVVDNLRLSGKPSSLTGHASLTLLPATHGKDIVLGGSGGLVPDVTLATLQGFAGPELNIGAPAFPATTAPFAGNVRVEKGLSVGNTLLTIGGLGDVTLDNHMDAITSDRAINIVAVGDRGVFPGLVDHAGGNILDTDAMAGAPATLRAPEVNVIAQGRVGTDANALEIEVGSGGRADFVTGAANAFINTVPGGESVENVVATSPVLAAFQAQGFFLDALSQAALARTVGLETTGLETTGLGELLYIDEGVYLLPDPYTTPVQATLLPALMDPDFPADLRPDDPNDEQAWQAFYSGVLGDYVQSRYLLSDTASESERAAVNARIESEWQALVEYFEDTRKREHAASAADGVAEGG